MQGGRCLLWLGCLLVGWPGGLQAQHRGGAVELGYFAPYLVQSGISLGYNAPLQRVGPSSPHQLRWQAELSYFAGPDLARQLLVNPALAYRWQSSQRAWYGMAALGCGYWGAWQVEAGSLNLATGAFAYDRERTDAWLPNLQLGLGLAGQRALGGFFKVTLGQRLAGDNAPAAFLGLTAGLSFRINPSS